MKILWIVNMVMPELAKHLNIQTGVSGTWMFDLSRMLADQTNVDLAIACVHGDGKTLKSEKINGIAYYMLPGNAKNMLFYTPKI